MFFFSVVVVSSGADGAVLARSIIMFILLSRDEIIYMIATIRSCLALIEQYLLKGRAQWAQRNLFFLCYRNFSKKCDVQRRLNETTFQI